MLKFIGLLAFAAGLFACFQPQLVEGLLGDSPEQPLSEEVLNASNRGGEGEEYTAYAAGYNAEDFGDAFTSPDEGKFAVKEIAPPTGVWADLLELKFKIYFDKDEDDVVFEPKFSEAIRAHEGMMIEVEGFIIPHDIAAESLSDDAGDKFMFSAFPLISCFFCGEAGAESVMEVTPSEPISYTERKVKIRGRLEFNTTDFMRLPYMLKDVTLADDNL